MVGGQRRCPNLNFMPSQRCFSLIASDCLFMGCKMILSFAACDSIKKTLSIVELSVTEHVPIVAETIGRFKGSMSAILLAAIMFSETPCQVNAAPVPISTSMPSINTLQPHFAFNFCRFKSSAFRNQPFPSPFSIQSPKKTNVPPILAAAATTTALVNNCDDEKISPKMQVIILIISEIPYVAFGATVIVLIFRHAKGIPPVTSPETAVKVAISAEVKGKQ